MPVDALTVVSYNTWQEKGGRDPALDSLLVVDDVLLCLQEVRPGRAFEIKQALRGRALVSPGRHGLQWLAVVVPEGARIAGRRAVTLNGYGGILPAPWSVRRALMLLRAGNRLWRDCLEPRVAQVVDVWWKGRKVRVVNTHLPLEPGLRNRCLERLWGLLGRGDVLLVGDLNATRDDAFLNDLILASGLCPAGDDSATHRSGRRIDYVLFRGVPREAGYQRQKGKSDHFVLRVELEVE